ncbi:DNA polymerase subunit gamma-2, mitochondrial isoform X2 [Lingula anatina]|uniref:DNA polymerase subunit gamma-2, mitochondrial isoform X2 n=1 Tax=Lingula anatina TaxID=7574 RepID=A0A1S3IEY0_LINAN|nr:DNA polymerase subunit gamma-2, mitochondrial isoform X2 [Lingula anatina]|eukprot:XP_013396698.1 DNA polymerase subunit gamma-2, mitochondrial isoform X2 [Lingula anatina]
MLEKIAKLCTKHGFVFPVESRVNGSLLTCYDFGPMGAAFSSNILKEWWDSVVLNKPSIYPVINTAQTSCPDSVPIGMDKENPLFLPPSLAKGTLLWYPYVFSEMNHRLPLGIVQCGKCFTRENIDQSKFIYQSSVFTQLLLQYFVSPKDTNKWFGYWVQERLNWWRTVTTGKKSVVPQLIESSTILEQAMLAYLVDSYEEGVKNSDTKEMKKVIHLHPRLAPYKVAVATVHSQDHSTSEMREVADYVGLLLSESGIMALHLKESTLDSIYTKMDESGIPYCVIIDEKTFINGVVSLRSRDTSLKDQLHLSDVNWCLVKILETY